jgi:hypothetical protein
LRSPNSRSWRLDGSVWIKGRQTSKAGLNRTEDDWRILEHLIASSSRKERDKSKKEKDREKERRSGLGLAMGYEVMEIRDEGDEGELKG